MYVYIYPCNMGEKCIAAPLDTNTHTHSQGAGIQAAIQGRSNKAHQYNAAPIQSRTTNKTQQQ